MSKEKEKYCKNCIHFRRNRNTNRNECMRYAHETVDYVNGGTKFTGCILNADKERDGTTFGWCGAEGRFFVQNLSSLW